MKVPERSWASGKQRRMKFYTDHGLYLVAIVHDGVAHVLDRLLHLGEDLGQLRR